MRTSVRTKAWPPGWVSGALSETLPCCRALGGIHSLRWCPAHRGIYLPFLQQRDQIPWKQKPRTCYTVGSARSQGRGEARREVTPGRGDGAKSRPWVASLGSQWPLFPDSGQQEDEVDSGATTGDQQTGWGHSHSAPEQLLDVRLSARPWGQKG